jgi:hypothetical protein
MGKYKHTYTHNPVQMVNVEHLKINQLQNDEFIEIDESGNETKIEKYNLTSKYEFRGCHNYYCCDAAKYLCTHHKDSLKIGNIYIEAEIKYEKFIDITIGDFQDQQKKLFDELSNVGKRKCCIPTGNGRVLIMTPFNIVYEAIKNEKIPEGERKRLENIEAKKIERIHFFFPAPIFKDYLSSTNKQFYKHPVNLYAKMYHILKIMQKELKETQKSPDKKDFNLIPKGINYEELLSSPTFVDGYIAFFDYLYKHGAGDERKKSISINEADLMKSCVPSLIHIDGAGKVKIRDKRKYGAFFKMAVILSYKIKGFDFRITDAPKPDRSDFGKRGWMIFPLDHPETHKISSLKKPQGNAM